MTQRIEFDELRRRPSADIIFIRAVRAAGDIEPTKDGFYNIEFRVEGKEVDFKKFCLSFETHFDAEIRAAAEDRLREVEGFKDLEDTIYELRKEFVDRLTKVMNDKFPAER
jgi:regulator of protease activity HflC (stomatin/prohibitin superfamily)